MGGCSVLKAPCVRQGEAESQLPEQVIVLNTQLAELCPAFLAGMSCTAQRLHGPYSMSVHLHLSCSDVEATLARGHISRCCLQVVAADRWL